MLNYFIGKSITSDPEYPVRLKYRNYHHHVRIGRLLEDFDSVAVATSYKHNESLFGRPKLNMQRIPFSRFDIFVLVSFQLMT